MSCCVESCGVSTLLFVYSSHENAVFHKSLRSRWERGSEEAVGFVSGGQVAFKVLRHADRWEVFEVCGRARGVLGVRAGKWRERCLSGRVT